MKISVLGLGYIGLPTALLFASAGHEVVGVDVNEKKVKLLNEGKLPFHEPGLEELFEKARNNFRATTHVEESDVFLIAVPTPLDEHTKAADLKYVKSAAEMVYLHLKKGNLVILESTVPPNTTERLLIPILEKSGLKAGTDFYVVHCPERAIPGKTIHEMIHNDRIVGGITPESAQLAKKLYESFVKGNIYLTDATTAEFVKLIENTYRDVNIALVNELAQIAEEYGINIWEAIELANKHPRVNLHKPGPGVGGHCIAIDPWFVIQNSSNGKMIALARHVNDTMPNYTLRRVREMLKGINYPTITVFGVAYKGNVDDARETPALRFIRLAENDGFKVKVYDPFVKEFEYPLLSLEEAIKDSDCIVVITDHEVFKFLDPNELGKLMRNKCVFDARNILDHEKWREAGFEIKVLGNGKNL
ncbi:UDP-N-acetyl-D-mannosamine dehydrogenase [Thermococcus celericrescens]|uniref:UDP-N-acetyl-D-mannosamine dehydrogenase n=1 Tax=Thermococcus celericrescens TaxID=227598 RepID=A0A117IUB8_9EURY|nr:nucleotide sugar dehydrogenase [Thermococcus celericrescens]KUH34400.1 UDP-N-acetyl-D-mannosamine dehydrogenase [Thermococcus celericrescens]